MPGKIRSYQPLKKLIFSLAVLFVLIAGVSFFSILTGSAEPGLRKLVKLLSGGASMETYTIFVYLRLPRIIFAIFIGAVLSVCGAGFQALLKNPLAEPYLLGISSGAAVGAIISMALGFGGGSVFQSLAAFFGGLLTIAVVYSISKYEGSIDTYRMILGGVIINAFLSGFILFFLSTGDSRDLHTILFWMMGDLGMNGLNTAFVIIIPSIIGVGILLYLSNDLNLLMMDETTAKAMGVRVERIKFIVFVLASLLTGIAVAAGGVIGFVGLIVPHAVRLVFGSDNRFVLPLSALTGSLFLLIADLAARTLMSPEVIPIGVVTAFIGTPCFIFLLLRKNTG